VVSLQLLTRDNRAANDRILEGEFAKAKQKGKILLVLLPGKDRWLYSRIKYYGDVKFGKQTHV
jgi:eukaryotic translation initiation factor 2C